MTASPVVGKGKIMLIFKKLSTNKSLDICLPQLPFDTVKYTQGQGMEGRGKKRI